MHTITALLRTLFRHRWWILISTALITSFAIFYTRHMVGGFEVKATLYTGVASGYNLESDKRTDWAMVQNAMDNLISIIQAESTLERVSIRLFARILIQGNPHKDNEGITANSYRYTYDHLKNSPHGKEILALIDKNSEDKTVERFQQYIQKFKPKIDNYLYGLFYYTHPYYSFSALKGIKVQRRLSSDLLDITYTAGDPGISYNTMSILMKEFVNEYSRIRYSETDKVILYFEGELKRIGAQLHNEENELTDYNVEKRIINYTDETKEIAAISKEYELREQDVRFELNSTQAQLQELERHMDSNAKQVLKNMQFMSKLREASELTSEISETESTSTSNNSNSNTNLLNNKERLSAVRKELNELSDAYIGHKYTKEGNSRTNIITQWLDQTLLYEKAKAELLIMKKARLDLNNRYQFYAPVGTMLKQKERSIDFIERSYLATLQSYNEALMRKKSMEMTSASLKVLNEPAYPISSNPTNKKNILIAVCIGSFILSIALLVLIELLDRTLRDADRTKRVSGYTVAGAITDLHSPKYRTYLKIYINSAINELSNHLLHFLDKRKSGNMYLINFLTLSEQTDNNEIMELLKERWISYGLNVRTLSYRKDFSCESRSYILAQTVEDFYTPQGEDLLIVEYPPLSESNIPGELLKNANINLLLASANLGWKNIDQLLGNRLKEQVGKTPLQLYLIHAERYAVEEFTGILPPYTFFRKMTDRLSQLALTEKTKKKKKTVEPEEDDDN